MLLLLNAGLRLIKIKRTTQISFQNAGHEFSFNFQVAPESQAYGRAHTLPMPFLWENKMRNGLCSRCKQVLTEKNCSPSVLAHNSGGYCRMCQKRRWLSTDKLVLRDKRREYRKTLTGKASVHKSRKKVQYRYSHLLCRARDKDYPVSISFEEYADIVKLPCFYCGDPLPTTGSGIDRVDSEIGYCKDNVRPCCSHCNLAKSVWTESEFKDWVIKIHNHWVKD